MSFQKIFALSDLPFMQEAQPGNPSGIVPQAAASGSLGNMLYTAVTPGVGGNLLSVTHELAQYQLPTKPSAPSFSGTVKTVGTGGDYATLSAAVASVASGARLQILPGTITEATAVNINKSLEIFGTGSNCIIRRDSTTEVLTVSAANVYIHDLRVWNNQLASTDPSGLSSCITAPTMQQATQSGLGGIYIKNCLFTFPKMGVSIDAASWVIENCTFTSNSNTPGATIRAVASYGSTGTTYISGNTFNSPTGDGTRLICVAFNAAGPRGATFVTGYTGNLVLKDSVLAGNTVRAYIDTTGMFRAPGAISSLYTAGNVNFYMEGNAFGAFNYTSSPCLFFASAGAYSGASPINPYSFFGTFYVVNNTFGKRTTGTQKGCLAFTAAATPSSGGLGSFQTAFLAGGNTIPTPNVLPASPWVNGSSVADLLGVDTTFYTVGSVLTPSTPSGVFAVTLIGNDATVKVPANTLASSLASSLNADGAFSALMTAAATDSNNASTTGTVTLSGGVG